nr:substrate-binding domain-containing protein [uncultured Desulfobacter sp.]
MKKKCFFAAFVILTLLLDIGGSLNARDYALVSKSLDDENFKDTVTGCNALAELNGDRCFHIGAEGPADARGQALAFIQAARTGNFSGFAVSVVKSDTVANVVRQEIDVPVISFDSPFSSEDASVSKSYVGIDNISFGRDLAKAAKQLRPGGGTLFFMGDLHDANLALRIAGVRRELSGQDDFSADKRLGGENGWHEFKRSPWISGDEPDRAIAQISLMLKHIKPDVFISVGHWPILKPEAYREAVAPFLEDIRAGRHLMIVGVGKITPELQNLMNDRLIHGFISIDFFKIGREVYHTLQALSRHETVAPRIIIPNIVKILDRSLSLKSIREAKTFF